MFTYQQLRDFTQAGLAASGYSTQNPAVAPLGTGVSPMPLFHPGPSTIQSLQKLSPAAILFLTVGNGAGPTRELTYDRPFIIARVIGPQRDYEGAERLAWALDRLYLAVDSSRAIGDDHVLYITRTGGSPQLIDYDAADRYHFQCTYVAELTL